MWLLHSLPKILLPSLSCPVASPQLSPTRRVASCSAVKDLKHSENLQKIRTCGFCPQISSFWFNTLMFTHVCLVRRRMTKMNHLRKKMCNMPPAGWDFCPSTCLGDSGRCSFRGSEILYSWEVVWLPMEMKTFCVSCHHTIHKKQQHMSYPPGPTSTIYFTSIAEKPPLVNMAYLQVLPIKNLNI